MADNTRKVEIIIEKCGDDCPNFTRTHSTGWGEGRDYCHAAEKEIRSDTQPQLITPFPIWCPLAINNM